MLQPSTQFARIEKLSIKRKFNVQSPEQGAHDKFRNV